MAGNMDKIQLPTNSTDISTLVRYLKEIKASEPLNNSTAQGVYQAVKATGRKQKSYTAKVAEADGQMPARDTHTTGTLATYGLIRYIDNNKPANFVVSDLGCELISLYDAEGKPLKNAEGVQLHSDGKYVVMLLRVFSAWHETGKGRDIHPGKTILKLMSDPELDYYLTEHDVAYFTSNPNFKFDNQYTEIKNSILEFRKKYDGVYGFTSKPCKAEIFMPTFVSNWGLMEKKEIYEIAPDASNPGHFIFSLKNSSTSADDEADVDESETDDAFSNSQTESFQKDDGTPNGLGTSIDTELLYKKVTHYVLTTGANVYCDMVFRQDGNYDWINNAERNAPSGEDIINDVLNHSLFGIHIKEQNDALSEDRPHICIGWSRLGDLSDVATKDELTSRYVLAWPDSKPRSQGQNIGQIWRFINDVQVGDYVIFADGNLLHIGRVESDYYYDETQYTTQSEDYKNTRRVFWLKKNINREEVSESLHRSLMTAMSIWTMNDYRAAIADLIMGTYIKDERNDENDLEAVPPLEQKERFRVWMTNQRKINGEPYSTNTITSYISQMSRGYDSFDKFHGYESVFEIQNAEELNEYTEYLFNAPGFDEFNDVAGNKACSNGLTKYGQFLAEQNSVTLELRFDTPLSSSKPRNRIIFGAPGTGKSFMLNRDRKALLGDDNETDYERVTFHPDYSYANFVGTYKPVPYIDSDGKDAITYEYVPGPFMRVYVNALKNGRTEDVRPFLLIIEEINRANVAAVFGDIFQLLDRDEKNVSEYPIQASEDVKKYLAKELGGEPNDYGKIKLPNNMFIWATMNSADQGVFPMDTAFKRRWDFTYIGIDDNDADIRGKTVVLGSAKRQRVEWNKLRKAINRFLAKQKINEDKQLGPYFISRSIVVPKNGDEIDSASFIDAFKNKVLMYLFEDAAKQKRSTLFEGCFEGKGRYSEICREFEEKGIGIFYHEIAIDAEPEDLATANGNITETGDEQV